MTKPFMPDYFFHFVNVGDINVVVIIDKDEGGRSVTNGIENVLGEIEDSMGPVLRGQPIIYCDSNGIYDGIDAGTTGKPQIYFIGKTDEKEAAKAAVEYWNKKQNQQNQEENRC